jgi:hypothetical protein
MLVARVARAQQLGQGAVHLDGDYQSGALAQLVGERASSGTDLHHGRVAHRAERVGDATEDARIAQEVLPEALANGRLGPAALSAHLPRSVDTHRASLSLLKWP